MRDRRRIEDVWSEIVYRQHIYKIGTDIVGVSKTISTDEYRLKQWNRYSLNSQRIY